MSKKQSVRILVEDKVSKEIAFYTTFDVDDDSLVIEAPTRHKCGHLELEAVGIDNVVMTTSADVVMLDMAIDCYETFMDDSSADRVPWSTLSQSVKDRWLAVARKKISLEMLVSPNAPVTMSPALDHYADDDDDDCYDEITLGS